jgi:hypothetical protein
MFLEIDRRWDESTKPVSYICTYFHDGVEIARFSSASGPLALRLEVIGFHGDKTPFERAEASMFAPVYRHLFSMYRLAPGAALGVYSKPIR